MFVVVIYLIRDFDTPIIRTPIVTTPIVTTPRGAKQGGGLGGVSTPPEFWMGGLNTCQPPLILRKKNFFWGGGGLAPLKLI